MVIVKISDKVEWSGYKINDPLCGLLYKEEDRFLVPWSGIDPYYKMNCFTWSKYSTELKYSTLGFLTMSDLDIWHIGHKI